MKSLALLSCATAIAACLAGCGTARAGLIVKAPMPSAALAPPTPSQALGPAEAPAPTSGPAERPPASATSEPPQKDSSASAPVSTADSLEDEFPTGLSDLPLPAATSPDGPVGDLARAALRPHPDLRITLQDGLEIAPMGATSRPGLVFYPGGNVDPRAYAPLARAWALAGYVVCIPAMPRRLAILAPNRASAVMARHPEVQRWVVGGHSLGGVVASMYAGWHPQRVSGLMLLAAVPGPVVNLSRRALPALSVYGTQDPRVPLLEITTTARRLPPASKLVGITGGNHGQFGDYGPHPRDAAAEISREEQHRRIIAATRDWLDTLMASG